MFEDHLNGALDDYPTTISVALLEPEPDDEDEAEPRRAPATTKCEAREQDTDDYEVEKMPHEGAEGSVGCTKYGIWHYTWSENGKRRSKSIGRFPDRDAAWAAAEPLREAAKQQRRALYEQAIDAQLEAKFTERKLSQRHCLCSAEAVLGMYLDRKDTQSRTGGIRAMRCDGAPLHTNTNPIFSRATVSDFVADVEICARTVLTLPLHIALFRLVYIEARFSVERATKVFPQVMYDLHVTLGGELLRRGISPTNEYFREFKEKPKQLRQTHVSKTEQR